MSDSPSARRVMSSITTLLLDADGVIQKPGPGWRESLGALCGDELRREEFLEAVFEAERPCLTGERDFGTALEAVLDRWGSRSTLEEALSVWTRIEVSEDILGLVERLRRGGWRVALASNQQTHRAAHMSWALGYASRFDAQCYSCSLGAAKPQERFFTKTLATLDCPPEAALFIDDSPANVHSARAAGLSAEVFSLDQGHAALQDILRSYGIQAR